MKHIAIFWAVMASLLGTSNVRELRAETMKGPKYVPITCYAEKVKIERQVKQYLLHGDFDLLTALAQEYRHSKATLSDGSWKLNTFIDSFCGSNTNEWNQLLDKLEEWSTHETNDPAPIIAIGNAYWAFGKQARGNGYADTVTKEGWNLLRKRLAKGYSRLTAESKRCASCPGFYIVMLKMGVDGSMERKLFETLFEQGIKVEPKCPHIYEMKSYYMLPRWYGKEGELKEFVFTTADHYPEVALWVLWRLQHQGVSANVFRDERIEWDTIKVRLKRCIKPESMEIGKANMLAYLSDVAGDTETLFAALKSVNYQLDASMWRSQERLEEIANKMSEPSAAPARQVQH